MSDDEARPRRAEQVTLHEVPSEREGTRFVLKDLRRETLDQMTDAEAQAEGYPNLEMYRDLILRMHKGMEWDGTAKVWVHEFERCED